MKCLRSDPHVKVKVVTCRIRFNLLVLAFAATCSEMALQSVLSDSEGKMSKLSMYMSKSQKIRMDYSRHDGY